MTMHFAFNLLPCNDQPGIDQSLVDDRCMLQLALAIARENKGGDIRVSILVSANETETLASVRAQLHDFPVGQVDVHGIAVFAGTGLWYQQARAILYSQKLAQLGVDVAVFDESIDAPDHPLHCVLEILSRECSTLIVSANKETVSPSNGHPVVPNVALADDRSGSSRLAGYTSYPGVGRLSLWTPRRNSEEDFSKHARALISMLPDASTRKIEEVHDIDASVRLHLAYVSPVPPARSGISTYSVDLIAALVEYYDIDLIVEQSEVDLEKLPPNCKVRSAAWFEEHSQQFDRVLYHLGNSHFHSYMLPLCEKIPGVVVLHDFYLGDLLWAHSFSANRSQWRNSYYESHGYGALVDTRVEEEIHELLARYPSNFEFLRDSRGVIVHSRRASELAVDWLPSSLARKFRHVPLLRNPVPDDDRSIRRESARRTLALVPEDFVVCCFGLMGRAKANLEIIDAWHRMDADSGNATKLIFVGANQGGAYGEAIDAAITGLGDASSRVFITGWVDDDVYRHYLDAADVAVQLRMIDRGETSAAVLDCMNHGLPTIINSAGAMGEIDRTAVHALPATFTVDDIAAALIHMYRDPAARMALSNVAVNTVRMNHSPSVCAATYSNLLEKDFYRRSSGSWKEAVMQVAALPEAPGQNIEVLASLSNAIAHDLPSPRSAKQLLVDVSAICRSDLRTGIQRVVRALLIELIKSPPAGFRIEPVYFCDTDETLKLRYARKYALNLLDIDDSDVAIENGIVEWQSGDRFLGLDFSWPYVIKAAKQGLFDRMHHDGISMHFVIYDLLPVLRPEVFPQQAAAVHDQWLKALLKTSDSVACISHAVAGELRQWMDVHMPNSTVRIDAFHLGADVSASAPTRGLPEDADRVQAALRARPTFLTVGTIEPRKGVAQALEAFDVLWRQGIDVNLVLVGKPGWQVEVLIEALRSHPERDCRLFWLAGVSDEYLEIIYSQSTCLLAASEAEGFGLPLIEAAQKGLPIIARDIPVFREITEQNAFFFSGTGAWDLAEAITEWLNLHHSGIAPKFDGIKWLSWKQSAQALVEKTFGK